MKNEITSATDVLGVLMNPTVQKEIKRVQPKFDRTALVNEIIEAWPGGQKGFAQAIVAEFLADRPGGPGKAVIMKLVSDLISKETESRVVRPVEDMTEAELAAVIRSALPALAKLQEDAGA